MMIKDAVSKLRDIAGSSYISESLAKELDEVADSLAKQTIQASDEAWDTRALGADERFVEVASDQNDKEVPMSNDAMREALDMMMCTFRAKGWEGDPAYEKAEAALSAAAGDYVRYEAVGAVAAMPGTDGGFTMITFSGNEMPVGSIVYRKSAIAAASKGDGYE